MKMILFFLILVFLMPSLAGAREIITEFQGINDEIEFRDLVSCLSETDIKLSNACIAPIIFIMSGSEDKWFSVTDVETRYGK